MLDWHSTQLHGELQWKVPIKGNSKQIRERDKEEKGLVFHPGYNSP